MPSVRCVNCRSDISVPDSYAHGDHIKCGACGTRHKVQRGESLRLVIADTAPLKDALAANESLIARLETDLSATKGAFGIGVNGLAVGLLYLGWQIVSNGQLLSTALILRAACIAVGLGLLLEIANYFFLTKRAKIIRINQEIDSAREEGRRIQQRIRDAGRV